MNIMENKRVTAIAALMALLFIGICYKGYEKYSILKQAEQDLAERASQLDSYEQDSRIPSPSPENGQAVSKAAKTVAECVATLSADLNKYAANCAHIREQKLTAIAFQNRLKELSAAIISEAGENCRINNEADKMGMTKALKQLPPEAEVPYRNFLAAAIYHLEQIIISSGSPRIERVYFEGLPENIPASSKYFPLSFEISFAARRSDAIQPGEASSYSVLPQVINKVIHDGKFFYIITGMAVGAQSGLPMLKSTADAAEASAAESDDEEKKTSAPQTKASLLIGTPDEEVTVHLNVQVLYFAADSL